MKAVAKRRNRKKLTLGWLSLLWIAAVLSAATIVRADIYFWEDDNGVIHFSNQQAPPKASLYMREPSVLEQSEPAMEPQSIERETDTLEVARQQADIQARLDETNRKLSQALERVDELTASVSRSRTQAVEAAEAARLAEVEAETARRYQNDVKERIIVHSVPYRNHSPYKHSIKKHGAYKHQVYGKGNRHFRHFKQDKKIVPYYNNGKRSRLYKLHLNQGQTGYDIKPTPILPPGRSRIPRAYGIR